MSGLSDYSPVIICGAGIGGLTLALYLAKYGISTIVLEKVPVLKEIGAGLQLSPNATQLLNRLGLLEACMAKAVQPCHINLCTDIDKLVISLPIKQYTCDYNLSPYITIARADLQAIMLQAIQAQSLIEIKYGYQLVDYRRKQNKQFAIEIQKKTGERYIINTSHLICADGIHSSLKAKPKDSGYLAWRSIVPYNNMLKDMPLNSNDVYVFMDKSGHLVCYPIGANKNYNCVMVTKTNIMNANQIPLLKKLLPGLPTQELTWKRHPIHIRSDIGYMNKDGVIFIGDAAHGFLPFSAQGAAMAIEDAASLAIALCSHVVSLDSYAARRLKRIAKLNRRAQLNQLAYHASGPIAKIRNLALRTVGGKKLIADLDWLYNYNALEF